MGSTGHLLVLGGLLAVVVATRAGAVAVLLACAAALERWGSPSLAAVAGGQAVLGPAVLVGSAGAAASAWLSSIAIVLTARDRLTAPALGLAAAALAAGPTLTHAAGTRIAGAIVGVAVAVAATRLPRSTSLLAVVVAGGAVVLAVVS